MNKQTTCVRSAHQHGGNHVSQHALTGNRARTSLKAACYRLRSAVRHDYHYADTQTISKQCPRGHFTSCTTSSNLFITAALSCEQLRDKAFRYVLDSRHEPISSVVDVPGHPPPARSDQLCASLSLQRLQILDRWVVGITSECVLLRVCTPECAIAQGLQAQYANQANIGDGLHQHKGNYSQHTG